MYNVGRLLHQSDWLAGLKVGALVAVTLTAIFTITASVMSHPASARADELLGKTATSLPPRVTESILSAVSVQRTTAASKTSGKTSGTAASGVVIADDLVLTAGHAVMTDSRMQCTSTIVDAPGAISSDTVSRDTVTAGSAIYNKSADIALLRVTSGSNFRELPDIKLAGAELRKEQLVYFVNYQSMADGSVRMPSNVLEPGKAGSALPAVYSAVVLGGTKHGYAVATNQRTQYSMVAEQFLRQGGSGGPVFDIQGRLAGLSVSTDALQPQVSARQIADRFGVRLPAGQYQIAYVQPVSQALLERLQSGLSRCE